MFSGTTIDLLEQTTQANILFSTTNIDLLEQTTSKNNAQQANILFMTMIGLLIVVLLFLIAITVLAIRIYQKLGSTTEVICFLIL